MQRLTENKIVLVTRRTRVDELIARFNTLQQAKFYVEHLGADFAEYLDEHNRYRAAVAEAETTLKTLGRVQMLDRSFLPNFVFGPQDTVVVLGQDGLVANTVKYLTTQSVLGVNPDPKRWDGVLLPFKTRDLMKVIPEVFAGRRGLHEVTMAKATLNNGSVLYGVNDLFIGPKTHTSARYLIQLGEKQEHHSSSGVIVSTGIGSTGWLKSLIAGAVAISSELSHGKIKMTPKESFPWDAKYLYFIVREPFPSRISAASLVVGKITEAQPLVLTSQTPEQGVIFSDGIESDYLEFNSGTRATITLAEKRGHLVV